ncbi:hypothetical protein ALQ38_01249 [Pseudomonas marginalis pv. marginalis]|nr:hypothetical protein ALQ38_01249 [Pseudomonas marginalis pv. marginalis]
MAGEASGQGAPYRYQHGVDIAPGPVEHHRVHRATDHAGVRSVRPRLLVERHDPDRRWLVPGVEHHSMDPEPEEKASVGNTVAIGFAAAIGQILLLDLVFSIDSIITAVGMTEHLPIMIIAVVTSVIVMLVAAEPLAKFINDNPTVVMLALGFLIMIGMTLIAEGFGAHVPKGYVYAAMAFSAAIECLNIARRNRHKRLLAARQ